MKFQNSYKKQLLLTVLFFSTLPTFAQYFEGVCRKASAYGFEQEAIIGHTICGNNTSIMANTKVYITTKDGYLYAQSNYIVPGYDFEYPSKVSSTNQMDLGDIAMNIFYADQPNEYQIEQAKNVMLNQVEIIIDPKIVNETKFNSTDFYSAKKLKFICPDNTNRDALLLKQKNGSIEYLIRYNENLSTRIKNQNLDFIFTKLKNTSFDAENIKIISLLENTATKDILAKDFSDKVLNIKYDIEDFKKALLSNKNKRTIILGHIENDNFITLDKGGKELFKISIEEIVKFKKENNLAIILLGCNSGVSSGSGVLNKFVSVDVLNRLKVAIKNNTIETFLNDLSEGTLDFVLDDTFFTVDRELVSVGGDNTIEKIEFEVFTKRKRRNKEIYSPSVGRIIFLESFDYLTEQNSEIDSTQVEVGITNLNDSTISSNNDSGNTTTYIILGLIAIIGTGYFLIKSKK